MDQRPHAGRNSAPPSKMATLDAPLHTIGFEIDELSAEKVFGHLLVTPECCQPFNKLHGGVSALIGEALASMGAYVVSGFKRVAGIHLSIHHLKSAEVGDYVVAEASPVRIGKSVQVWEVRLCKCDPSKTENRKLISLARVTMVGNLPTPDSAKDVAVNYKKYAKLYRNAIKKYLGEKILHADERLEAIAIGSGLVHCGNIFACFPCWTTISHCCLTGRRPITSKLEDWQFLGTDE